MSKLFNDELFESKIKELQNIEVEYRIGVSKIDKENFTYCLVRAVDKINIDFLLLKTIKNENEFDFEVHNLQKIFNALVIEEK
jgi:invasion protein IalB